MSTQRHRALNEPLPCSFSLAAIPLMYWPQYGHVYTKSEQARQSTACPHGLSATHSPAWLHAMHRRPSSELLKTEAGSDDSRTKSRAGVPMAATSPRLRLLGNPLLHPRACPGTAGVQAKGNTPRCGRRAWVKSGRDIGSALVPRAARPSLPLSIVKGGARVGTVPVQGLVGGVGWP